MELEPCLVYTDYMHHIVNVLANGAEHVIIIIIIIVSFTAKIDKEIYWWRNKWQDDWLTDYSCSSRVAEVYTETNNSR